jgi:hypothetical protein
MAKIEAVQKTGGRDEGASDRKESICYGYGKPVGSVISCGPEQLYAEAPSDHR